MNAFPCRCRRCDGRRTLSRVPDEMRNTCQCAACRLLREQGRDAPIHCDCGGAYRVDWYRKRKEHVQRGCKCSGFPFDNGVHRIRSSSPDNDWYCVECFPATADATPPGTPEQRSGQNQQTLPVLDF